MEKELIFYEQADGKVPFTKWLSKVNDFKARNKIEVRLLRLVKGNYGDCKALRKGVFELRIDYAGGYRLYFAEQKHRMIVVLLLGGTKKTQSKDIDVAIKHWEDYQRRY